MGCDSEDDEVPTVNSRLDTEPVESTLRVSVGGCVWWVCLFQSCVICTTYNIVCLEIVYMYILLQLEEDDDHDDDDIIVQGSMDTLLADRRGERYTGSVSCRLSNYRVNPCTVVCAVDVITGLTHVQ